MAREEFQIGAFVSYLNWLSVNHFRDFLFDTGLTLPPQKSQAFTRYERHIAERFVDWAAESWGRDELPADFKVRVIKQEDAPSMKRGPGIWAMAAAFTIGILIAMAGFLFWLGNEFIGWLS